MTLMLQIINRKYLMNCAIDKEKTLRFSLKLVVTQLQETKNVQQNETLCSVL